MHSMILLILKYKHACIYICKCIEDDPEAHDTNLFFKKRRPGGEKSEVDFHFLFYVLLYSFNF